MIRNIKKTFLPKTGVRKSSFLQDPGYVREMCAALLHACRIFIVVFRDVREGSNYIETLQIKPQLNSLQINETSN